MRNRYIRENEARELHCSEATAKSCWKKKGIDIIQPLNFVIKRFFEFSNWDFLVKCKIAYFRI